MTEIAIEGSSPRAPASQLWRRLISVALALGLELAMLIALLTLGSWGGGRPHGGSALTMVQASAPRASHANSAPKHQAAVAKAAPPKLPPLRVPPPISDKTPTPAPFIEMSKDDFAASDISKLGSKSASDSGAKGNGPAYGPGEGPGGAQLLNAEWYVEPTHGELAAYLPNGAPPGSWATIACQTVPHYHVENCEALDESPPGSGLARALRRAAWQFLVRPPTLNGQPQMGKWVRIRFNWTERGER